MTVVSAAVDRSLGQELEELRRPLVAYCYRMLGSPHEAEDAVQDTMARAWRGLGGMVDRSGLRPWVYKIATGGAPSDPAGIATSWRPVRDRGGRAGHVRRAGRGRDGTRPRPALRPGSSRRSGPGGLRGHRRARDPGRRAHAGRAGAGLAVWDATSRTPTTLAPARCSTPPTLPSDSRPCDPLRTGQASTS